MNATSPTQAPQLAVHFPVLDTLRLIGALAVLTTHVAFQTGGYLRNGTWGVLMSRLDVGVAIFFVLSGFLLSRAYLVRAARGAQQPALVDYARKRALRILPVYVVTVALALLLAPGNGTASLGQWLSSLLLLDAYHLAQLPFGLTHMWSLSAEVAFYALLPFLMLLAPSASGLSNRRLGAVLALLVSISMAWHLVVSDGLRSQVDGAPGIWLPAYLTWFAVGIGIAFVHVRWQEDALPRFLTPVVQLGSQPGVCWGLSLGLLLVAATPIAGPVVLESPTAGESLAKHVLYASIGALLVLSGVFTDASRAYAKAMSWGPLRHLGQISYSIFCIHMLLLVTIAFPVAGVDEFTGQGLRVWVVTLVLSLGAGELLYRLVELPAMRFRPRRAPGVSAPAQATTPHTPATTK